jgi:hypothetical protein
MNFTSIEGEPQEIPQGKPWMKPSNKALYIRKVQDGKRKWVKVGQIMYTPRWNTKTRKTETHTWIEWFNPKEDIREFSDVRKLIRYG